MHQSKERTSKLHKPKKMCITHNTIRSNNRPKIHRHNIQLLQRKHANTNKNNQDKQQRNRHRNRNTLQKMHRMQQPNRKIQRIPERKHNRRQRKLHIRNTKKKLRVRRLLLDYIPKNFSALYTKNAGHTIAFKKPRTPIQKPEAVEI